MAKTLKKWQGWLIFGGAMVIVFVLGLLCSVHQCLREELRWLASSIIGKLR